MAETRPPLQLCEDDSSLFGQHSRMYYTGLAALPWRTQLISGALPLNPHVRPLIMSLSGPRRTELQSLLWPHIVHRYNVVFIDNPLFAPEPPPSYDNTMDSGFVVPMLLRIAESCARRHLTQLYNEGPLAIVVVATLEESLALVEEIRTAAIQFDRDFRVVNVFEMPDEKEFQEKSYLTAESCDVLIVALHSVLALFATQGRLWSAPINLMKVELVVFRNIDMLLRINPTQTETVLGRFRENSDINFVFAASASSPALKKVVGKLENTFCTVITNYLDAVVHEKLPMQLYETNAKFSLPWCMQAQKTFQDRQPGEKIVLFVGSDRQGAELKQTLALPRNIRSGPKTLDYDFQTVSESDSIYDVVNVIRDWWKSDPKEQVRILAIPDKYANDFGIDDADLIVHLSPPSCVLQFLQRFVCIRKQFALWSSKYTALAKGNSEKVVLPSIPCRIVLDEGWKPLLPIVLYMASAAEGHSIIPAQVVTISQKVLQSPRFMQLPPCLMQLYYGDCMKKGSCAARHYYGRPPKLPGSLAPDRCSKFEFRLMRYLNPMHFIARIVRVFSAGDNVSTSYERVQKDLDEELANVLDDLPQPYQNVPDPDVICGMVSINGQKLYRVQVLKVIDKDHLHVFYVDEGVGMPFLVEDRRHPKLPARVKSGTKFYPLPEKIINVDKTWVNVIIARVRPSLQEVAWRPSTSAAVYTAIKNHIVDEKSLMEAKAVFSSEDFIFVDNYKSWKVQEGRNVCMMSMQNILSRNTRLAANTTHLDKLTKSLENESPSRGQSLSTTLPLYVAASTEDERPITTAFEIL